MCITKLFYIKPGKYGGGIPLVGILSSYVTSHQGQLGLLAQVAYNSGKTGNLREFVDSGKLREFQIYSGNFVIRLL